MVWSGNKKRVRKEAPKPVSVHCYTSIIVSPSYQAHSSEFMFPLFRKVIYQVTFLFFHSVKKNMSVEIPKRVQSNIEFLLFFADNRGTKFLERFTEYVLFGSLETTV